MVRVPKRSNRFHGAVLPATRPLGIPPSSPLLRGARPPSAQPPPEPLGSSGGQLPEQQAVGDEALHQAGRGGQQATHQHGVLGGLRAGGSGVQPGAGMGSWMP